MIERIALSDGGPPAVVAQLAAHQSRMGHDVHVLCVKRPGVEESWSQWRQLLGVPDSVQLLSVQCNWARPRRQTLGAAVAVHRFDVMHLHGIWGALVWNVLALRHGITGVMLLAPHGMLSGWSLAQKSLKKRVALELGWRRAMARCDAIHVLHQQERSDVATVIGDVPSVVIPNGVPSASLGGPHDATSVQTGPCVLFLARLHHVKGPERLLCAFRRVVDRLGPGHSRLVLAGPDGGELGHLRSLAKRLGIESHVEFAGPVFGPGKSALLAAATVFCQPSRYEGFSVSILEALAAGVPVVTTPETNFPEIASQGAGFICQGTPQELGDALFELLTQPLLARRMGEAGQQLVRDRYTWDRIVESCLATYEDLLNGRTASQRR